MQFTGAMAGVKQTMKGLCIHEKMHSTPALCPKIVTDKVCKL